MKKIDNILFHFLFLLPMACTEPFPIQTITFENILVVESTITDEMKHQVVKLSRTIPLDSFGQEVEENADVKVEDSNGNTFGFSENAATGNYISDQEFSAVPGVAYTLKVRTQDGNTYTSAAVEVQRATPMDRVYAELISNNGEEGIQVFVDTDNTEENAQYFRYEYEETYKVQLPTVAKFDWEILNFSDFTRAYDLELTPIEWEDQRVCYPSVKSAGVIQASAANLDEKRIFRFPLRFIGKKSPIIRNRYSILVKQYLQSEQAFTFYQILEDLGNVESLLSQGQPGYVTGNVTSETNSEEKVLGFFEASSVSSQRIYFNYQDFGLELPPYFVVCEQLAFENELPEILKRKLELEHYQVYFVEEEGIMRTVYITQSECSECDTFSTNIKPDFWED